MSETSQPPTPEWSVSTGSTWFIRISMILNLICLTILMAITFYQIQITYKKTITNIFKFVIFFTFIVAWIAIAEKVIDDVSYY